MFEGLQKEYQDFLTVFDLESKKYFESKKNEDEELSLLWDSMSYTFFLDGKRFRPFLCYLISLSHGISFHKIFNYALAIEMVHTYSLIHDDLPCMDNDDFRRGQPSNHKVFGEDIALLAGDALLTEALRIASDLKGINSDLILKAMQLFSHKIGALGMVGGQVLDMKVNSEINIQRLEKTHLLKTGYLIEASVVGAAILCGADDSSLEKLSAVSQQLGIAFQIKDDLLDGLDSNQDYKNYIYLLGEEKTLSELQKITLSAKEKLNQSQISYENLKKIFDFNFERKK